MGKAITGAAELAGAIGMGAIAFFDPAVIAIPGYAELMLGLGLTGLATEAGAIADALTSNRGENITTRQPASFRQMVYGMQRIGGVEIWRSTTGSSHDQFNFVIVLATHELSAITDLYLDGRKVYWQSGSSGQSTRNGYTFGGSSNGSDYTGPDGTTYNFGDRGHGPMVYCEARYGDQAVGDYIAGLTANDPDWGPSGGKTPTVSGCAYVYLKLEYDSSVFPAEPEIRFTVLGKPVYDPRSSATAYSANPALVINDILQDEDFGVGGETCNQDQLVAAANVCDETLACSAGTEARYATHWHYDTSTEPGDAIAIFLDACGGRMSKVSGEWYIFPAVYSAPVLSLGPDQLRGPVVWSEKRAGREIFNRVTGTYTAANYPYNVAGDLYDSNGWYDNTIENNFPFAFQPSNYPMYACDTLHGYASDQYLTEDGNARLPKEIGFPQVLSISQAQRLAKIALLRNRQQGTGSISVSLEAFQLSACDTFNLSFAAQGWVDKLLEVNAFQFFVDTSSGVPLIKLALGVNETDPTVYDWSTEEELTPYDVPAMPGPPSTVAAPTSVALTSSAATAIQQPDGSIVPRIEVTWNTPLDILVTQILVQYRLTGSTTWISTPSVPASQNAAFLYPIVAGQSYDVRVCSQRSKGATSVWVEEDGFTAGFVLASTGLTSVGAGSLRGEAYSDGTAAIICNPFSALVGTSLKSIFPAGAVTISGLTQQTLYYVYYDDPTYAGGNVTPVATTNMLDVLGVLGRFLIDSVVTPYCGSSGPSSRYIPSTSSDTGTSSTTSPENAYDNDLSTYASVVGAFTSLYPGGDTTTSNGACTWSGFPAIVTTVALTLTVTATFKFLQSGASGGSATLAANYGTTLSTLTTITANAASATYTLAIPSGTDLSTIFVTAAATPGSGTASSGTPHVNSVVTVEVTEIVVG